MYSGSADGSLDVWLELMEERLDGSSMSEKDKILSIKDRKRLSQVFKLLSGKFESAQNERQAIMS